MRESTVRHADLFGLRAGKYQWLAERALVDTEWHELQPNAPFYLFVPQNEDLRAEYEQGWKITDIFGTGNSKQDSGKNYGLGICTHNDLLFVDWNKEELYERVRLLADKEVSDATILEKLPVVESRYWNTQREREKVRSSKWKENFLPLYYRPFDWRTIYYEPGLMEIGRGGASKHVMQHVRHCGLNLMASRGYEVEAFEHVLVSNAICVHHAATRKEGNYVFPLYRYSTAKTDLFDNSAAGSRRPNLAPEFIADFSARLQLDFVQDGCGDLRKTFGPEDVFHYAYAVFHSPTYRSRYAQFLKIDFPRLPLTSSPELFRNLCALGGKLVKLHLLEAIPSPQPSPGGRGGFSVRYPIAGDNKVENVRYTEQGADGTPGRVWINTTQYFEGVPPEVWNFHVGGYQVCHKWLKDRKGRQLSYDDLTHYQRIVAALAETLRIQAEIDNAIGEWPIQ